MDELAEHPPDTALAGAAFAYVDFGVAHGLDRATLLAAARLDDALRGDPDARISTFAYVALWRALISALPEVVIPVALVEALDTPALGITAQIVLRADDLVHATHLIERFLRLTDTALIVQWPERDGLIGFELVHRPEVMAMRYPIELMIGMGY